MDEYENYDGKDGMYERHLHLERIIEKDCKLKYLDSVYDMVSARLGALELVTDGSGIKEFFKHVRQPYSRTRDANLVQCKT